MVYSKPKPPDEERPEHIIDDMLGSLEGFHILLTDAAAEVGQAQEQLQGIRDSWRDMAQSPTNDPDAATIYISGVHALAAYRDQLAQLADRTDALSELRSLVSGSSDGTAAITSVTQSFISIPSLEFSPSPSTLPTRQEAEEFEQMLQAFDRSLAATYRGIREALYGTRSDPERAALFESRQAFDHLFSRLAPDHRVRASQYWKRKPGPNPSKVTRDERLRYAANTHARSPTQARSLIASSRHMLNVHDALSRAHERGELDTSRARHSLREMDVLLREWIRSVDLDAVEPRSDASA